MKYFYQEELFALNSNIILSLVTDNSQKPDTLFNQMIEVINIFENQFSRFKTDSELIKVNHKAGQKTVVSNELIDILIESKRLGELSEGLFNPFILPNLQQAGYLGSWPNTKNADPKINFSNSRITDIKNLEIGSNWIKIPANTALDLGGIGKGFLLDKLSNFLINNQCHDYWISIGGDIIVNGQDEFGHDWSIEVANALNTQSVIGSILNNQQLLAVATSGITKRHGNYKYKKWNHLIDPRSGLSINNNILTCTVSASRAIDSDVAAKTILIEPNMVKKLQQKETIKNCFIQQLTEKKTIKIKQF